MTRAGRAASNEYVHGLAAAALLLLVPRLGHAGEPAAACRVAIDVGHDRATRGATSARGVAEWEFNAALGADVVRALSTAGVPAFLVNEAGRRMDRPRRLAAIERVRATLLVALHHDSVQPRYLSTWTWGGRKRRYCDRFQGYSLFVSSKNGAFAESERTALDVGGALRDAGLAPTLHHAEPIAGENRPLLDRERGVYTYDQLGILRDSPVPAVLLEAAVIVHRDDERRAASAEHRAKLASAIASAALGHCERLRTMTAATNEPRTRE